ncbi:MAG: hypothetical protein AAGC73_10730, partial [Verrucomicrobiota bacterium]
VLAVVFWVILRLLAVVEARYIGLLTMITLTSFPAILYAIPVEKFMTMELARVINLWFLAVVAIWRVALFGTYLHRLYALSGWVTMLALLLPLMAIVASLAVLNLEHVVFNIMAGIDESPQSANDAAYRLVFFLAALSYLGFVPVLLVFLATVCWRWSKRRESS